MKHYRPPSTANRPQEQRTVLHVWVRAFALDSKPTDAPVRELRLELMSYERNKVMIRFMRWAMHEGLRVEMQRRTDGCD